MSRSQRRCNSQRNHTQQIRHLLLNGTNHFRVEYVPMEKVAHGHADPTR